MSLILDALRKLERERERPDPGVVVVGPVPWHGLSEPRRVPLLVGSVAVVMALAAAGLWLARRAPATPAPAPAATPIASPVVSSPSAASLPMVAAPSAPPVGSVRAPRAPFGPAPAARKLAVPEPLGAGAAAPKTDASTGPATSGSSPAAAPGRHDTLQLMAIAERDGHPIAIISDHMVREGDSFDGVKVLRIGATEVEVEERGQRRVLRF